jgi:hypothetical protein
MTSRSKESKSALFKYLDEKVAQDMKGFYEAFNIEPTSIPKRLSITQIREIADKCDEGQEPSEYLIAFARAIENATISRIFDQ